MNDQQIGSAIRASVNVSRQQVSLSKGIILESAKGTVSPLVLIQQVMEKNRIKLPNPLVFGSDGDANVAKTVSDYLSWHHAACEAIWALVHAGVLSGGDGFWRDSLSSIRWGRV